MYLFILKYRPPLGDKYWLMSFEGTNMKGEREKREKLSRNEKKIQKIKEKLNLKG
jgi:hypothetical protein